MGVNAVSAFIYYDSLAAGNLPDFLRQCERNDLKVNLALRPGTPHRFRLGEMESDHRAIEAGAERRIFAYDLAWEPTHGTREDQQKNYTAAWREWVKKKYGSVEAA